MSGIEGAFGLPAGVLRLGVAQRGSLELDVVGAVDEAVADGVGEGGVASTTRRPRCAGKPRIIILVANSVHAPVMIGRGPATR